MFSCQFRVNQSDGAGGRTQENHGLLQKASPSKNIRRTLCLQLVQSLLESKLVNQVVIKEG